MWRWNSRDQFLENNYYHIYNRWFEKQLIFNNDNDYKKFFLYIKSWLELYKSIKIVSYCFLPNHFHLVIHNLDTGLHLSHFMKKVQWAYSMYYKKKYSEIGIVSKWPFFEWRFKAKLIDTDQYLQQCLAYVNFNPLKHEIVDNIDNYPWTSYHQIDKAKIVKYKDLTLDELEL